MPRHIEKPTRITAAGNKPKLIDEYVGRVNSAHRRAEHRPHALAGRLERAAPAAGVHRVHRRAARACCASSTTAARSTSTPARRSIAEPGERVRYSTPLAEGAEYIAVCLPAFSPDTVHRED